MLIADIDTFGTGAEGKVGVITGAGPIDAIRVQVDGVSSGHACESSGLYAVAYTGEGSFAQRDGEVLVALAGQGGGTFFGDITVGAGATDVAVVAFCDDSQESFTATIGSGYDTDIDIYMYGPTTTVADLISPNAYSNQGTLNICARNINVPPLSIRAPIQRLLPYPGAPTPTGITSLAFPYANPMIYGNATERNIYGYTPTNFITGIIGTLPAAGLAPPAMIVEPSRINVDPGTATIQTGSSSLVQIQKEPTAAGDRFATGIATAGTTIAFDVDELSSLDKTTPHPSVQGTIAEWCRCILGQNMGAYPPPQYGPTSAMMFAGFIGTVGVTLPYGIGYFSVTNFTASATSASCLLP